MKVVEFTGQHFIGREFHRLLRSGQFCLATSLLRLKHLKPFNVCANALSLLLIFFFLLQVSLGGLSMSLVNQLRGDGRRHFDVALVSAKPLDLGVCRRLYVLLLLLLGLFVEELLLDLVHLLFLVQFHLYNFLLVRSHAVLEQLFLRHRRLFLDIQQVHQPDEPFGWAHLTLGGDLDLAERTLLLVFEHLFVEAFTTEEVEAVLDADWVLHNALTDRALEFVLNGLKRL